jgi:hypothetical protein
MESTANSRKQEFNRFLLEAVDETLSTLGERAKESIYVHLKKKFNLSHDEIPERIGEYSSALEDLFGKAATLLEVQIMKRLHEKTGCFVEICTSDYLSLRSYVDMVRVSYLLDDRKDSVTLVPADMLLINSKVEN